MKPRDFDAFPDELADATPFGPYRAVIQRWADSDTCTALVDAGLNGYLSRAIRIWDYDGPERFRGTPEEREVGRQAWEYAQLICPPGTPVVLTTFKDRTTFGRYIAHVQLTGGRDFTSLMLAAGFGERIRYLPDDDDSRELLDGLGIAGLPQADES